MRAQLLFKLLPEGLLVGIERCDLPHQLGLDSMLLLNLLRQEAKLLQLRRGVRQFPLQHLLGLQSLREGTLRGGAFRPGRLEARRELVLLLLVLLELAFEHHELGAVSAKLLGELVKAFLVLCHQGLSRRGFGLGRLTGKGSGCLVIQ